MELRERAFLLFFLHKLWRNSLAAVFHFQNGVGEVKENNYESF